MDAYISSRIVSTLKESQMRTLSMEKERILGERRDSSKIFLKV